LYYICLFIIILLQANTLTINILTKILFILKKLQGRLIIFMPYSNHINSADNLLFLDIAQKSGLQFSNQKIGNNKKIKKEFKL
jgi:hypothetical protein